MKRTAKITAFFKKHKTTSDNEAVSIEKTFQDLQENPAKDVGLPQCSSKSTTEKIIGNAIALESAPTSGLHQIVKDVGLYLEKKPDDFTMYLLLEEHWKPPQNYNYPFSVNSKGVKRYLSKNHLEKHTWLVLSESKGGLFCKYCALFAKEKAGHNKGVKLGKLVVEPLQKFKDLTGKDGDLITHEQSLYHKNCVESAKDFLRIYKSPHKEVINQVSFDRLRQVTENRERLKPIVKTIILLGRQNIPLRGHRDDGPIREEVSAVNQGNFKAMLNFRVDAGDKVLEDHLKKSSSRATYISKTTQNILTECCGDEIREEILNRVNEAKYWSIMFDETTDLSHKEQMTLIVRYLWKESVREDFITFIDAYKCAADLRSGEELKENKVTGKTLGDIVLHYLKDLGLDLSMCVSIGTDGASVMTSEEAGSVKHIQREAVNAKRLPCYNHALNNSISKANKIQSIKNAVSIMKEVIYFFNQSSKRNEILNTYLGGQLVSLCETRWVDRHDAVILFYSALPEIVDAFAEISEWKESESAKKAVLYTNSVTSTEFIFSSVCLIEILKRTLPLSKLLQKPSLDLNKASNAVKDTLTSLQEMRDIYNEYFKETYLEAKTTAEKLDVELKMPITVKTQRHRENHEANTVEEYYRRSMYIPLLDHVINDLRARFPEDNLMCFDINLLLPAHIVNTTNHNEKVNYNDRIRKLIKYYKNLLPNGVEFIVEGEISMWRAKWSREVEEGTKIPLNVIDALKACDEDIYPTIRKLLQILATLPVSVASAERSFSSLKLIKSWLRTSMVEERLNGLCLLYIHRDIEVNVEKVIERYAKGGKRRIQLEIIV